jgi:hypothetical protein
VLFSLLSLVLIGLVLDLSTSRSEPGATPARPGGVEPLPPDAVERLDNAADAAGCELRSPRNEGVAHEPREFTIADYRSNPPTSGTHFPRWAPDGVYEPGTTPPLGELVHALEHGRVQLQYAEDAAPETPVRLRMLVDELEGGYHLLLYENRTGMPYAVAATAWDQLIGCPTMNEQVFDALRAFRNEYVDKAPEVIP